MPSSRMDRKGLVEEMKKLHLQLRPLVPSIAERLIAIEAAIAALDSLDPTSGPAYAEYERPVDAIRAYLLVRGEPASVEEFMA